MAENPLESTPLLSAEDFSAEYAYVRLMRTEWGKLPWDSLRRAINESVSDPATSPIDESITRLCTAYLSGDQETRERLRQRVKNGFSLLHYSTRMAVRALRSRNTTLMEGAGAAISLEDMRSDPRNTVTELAILRHVAIKLGVEWSAILRTIARDSSAKMREFIERFARRDPETLRLELFLLRETIDANGLTIEKIPMPGLPLAAKKRRNLPPIGGQIDVHM